MLALSTASLAAALVSPALGEPADFIGTWVNTNSNTSGVTRLVITSAGGNKLTSSRLIAWADSSNQDSFVTIQGVEKRSLPSKYKRTRRPSPIKNS
ncbi:hypothetical protein [Nostoc sp.]